MVQCLNMWVKFQKFYVILANSPLFSSIDRLMNSVNFTKLVVYGKPDGNCLTHHDSVPRELVVINKFVLCWLLLLPLTIYLSIIFLFKAISINVIHVVYINILLTIYL